MPNSEICETVFRLVLCHLVGDYVLQSDFLAKTKGESWYHLLVHCLLYCLPFYLAFGFTHLAALRAAWCPCRGRYGEDEIQKDWICY